MSTVQLLFSIMKQQNHACVMVGSFVCAIVCLYILYLDYLFDGNHVSNALRRITDVRLLKVISNYDRFCKSVIASRGKTKQKRFGDSIEQVCGKERDCGYLHDDW
jgi:hypothetical protein